MSVLPDRLPPWGHRRRTVLAFQKKERQAREQSFHKWLIAAGFVSPGSLNSSKPLGYFNLRKHCSKRGQTSVWIASLTVPSWWLLVWVIWMWSHALHHAWVPSHHAPPTPPLHDRCCCCLPEVPGGRQSSTLPLFVIVCTSVLIVRSSTLLDWLRSNSGVESFFVGCCRGAGICYRKALAFTVNQGDSFLEPELLWA